MKTTIRSAVELWEVCVFAEMAIWERRPDLQRLCAAVPEQGKLGSAEVDAALPGLSEAARRNIVQHVTYLRLVDEGGALTALGRRCAATGEAPAWELGAYAFLVAVHPVFRSCILDFRRLPSDSRNHDFKSLERLPDWFTPAPQRTWTSAFNAELRFTLCSLPAPRGVDPACWTREHGAARLVWEINLDTGRNSWSVEGEIDGARGVTSFRSPPESVPAQKLAGAFAGWESRWSPSTGRVAVPYDGRAAGGRESFLRTFKYPRVRIGELGVFEDVTVEGVPVGPSNAVEARQWALALLLARAVAADAYWTTEAWAREWDTIVRGTPLEASAGSAPAPASVGAVAGKPIPARVRWLISAAADLAGE